MSSSDQATTRNDDGCSSPARRRFLPLAGMSGWGAALASFGIAARAGAASPADARNIDARVQSACDITEITQLIVREREYRDKQNWPKLRDCYHPDSVVRISWFQGTGAEFVEASAEMFRKRGGSFGSHWVAAIPVHLAGDRAVAPAPLGIIDRGEFDGIGFELNVVSTGYYRLEKRGQWRISGFETSYERDSMIPLVPGDRIPIDRKLLASFRPSYRFLSYLWNTRGLKVNSQLPGSDRPDLVKDIEARVYSWARL